MPQKVRGTHPTLAKDVTGLEKVLKQIRGTLLGGRLSVVYFAYIIEVRQHESDLQLKL
jgi:hypothetical protein